MRQLPESPLQMLLRAWPPRLNLFFLRDLIVNVALYVPVGMSAHFAFRKWPLRFFDLYAPVVLGLLLSTSVELMQLYEPLRNASIVDIATNVIGAMLGVFLAVAFETFAEGTPASTVHRGVTDPAAVRTEATAVLSAFLKAQPGLRENFHGLWAYAIKDGKQSPVIELPMAQIP